MAKSPTATPAPSLAYDIKRRFSDLLRQFHLFIFSLFPPFLVATRFPLGLPRTAPLTPTPGPPSERQCSHIYQEIRQQSEGQKLLKNAGARCFHQMVCCLSDTTSSSAWRRRAANRLSAHLTVLFCFSLPLARLYSHLAVSHTLPHAGHAQIATEEPLLQVPKRKEGNPWWSRASFHRQCLKTVCQLSGFELSCQSINLGKNATFPVSRHVAHSIATSQICLQTQPKPKRDYRLQCARMHGVSQYHRYPGGAAPELP